MVDSDKIIYWAEIAQKDLNFTKDIKHSIAMCEGLTKNGLLRLYEIEDKGIFAYIISNNFRAEKELMEIFFYIKPEHRGNPRILLNTIKDIEQVANDNDCKYITIASNAGYSNQSKLLSILGKKGYNVDSVKKELK